MHPVVAYTFIALYLTGWLAREAYQLHQDDDYYQLCELFAVEANNLRCAVNLTRGF